MSDQKKDNLLSALAYIPFVSVFMYFLVNNKSKKLENDINYSILLLSIYSLILIFLNIIFLQSLLPLLLLLYIWFSAFLWFKAYSWEIEKIEILDNIINKFKELINNNTKDNTK